MKLFTCVDPYTGQSVQWPYPQTREQAIELGAVRFWPGTRCDVHGMQTAHFVHNPEMPSCCIHAESARAFNEAAFLHGDPVSPDDALARGLDYFWSPMTFSKCGHTGKSTLKGTCYVCNRTRANSPRQRAIKDGLAWYTPAPDDPCSKGHLAPRRVANGTCQECEKAARPGHGAEPFYRDPANANIILSRDAAKSMGLDVYRTGEACKYGHTGFRYVSTCGCLTCMGRT